MNIYSNIDISRSSISGIPPFKLETTLQKIKFRHDDTLIIVKTVKLFFLFFFTI